MNSFLLYGITVSIPPELQFDNLTPAAADPEVVIRYGPINFPWENSDQDRLFIKTEDGAMMGWREDACFYIKNGSEIIIDRAPECDDSLLRHMILGPVLSVLLSYRGFSVFHASTIELDGKGIALLAAKGHGKSTQAAAFVKSGKKLVSDDLLVLKFSDDSVLAMPGIPILKLWPEAITAVGGNPDEHPEIKPNMDKRVMDLTGKMVTQNTPIQAMYLLDLGDAIEILPLSKQDALQLIFQHWYGALFDGELLPLFGMSRQFQECINLVNRVPAFVLKRPESLSLLPNICQAIECHISETKF